MPGIEVVFVVALCLPRLSIRTKVSQPQTLESQVYPLEKSRGMEDLEAQQKINGVMGGSKRLEDEVDLR